MQGLEAVRGVHAGVQATANEVSAEGLAGSLLLPPRADVS